MHQTGLLIVTVPLRNLLGCVSHYLHQAKQLVHKRLYIKLEPGFTKFCRIQQRNVNDFQGLSKVIPAVYYKACECCADLDIRVLQAITKELDLQDSYIKQCFDVIITDSVEGRSSIQHYLKQQFNKTCQNIIQLKRAANTSVEENIVLDDETVHTYKTVVLGGTFDRLHSGHKVLLSEAVMRTTEKLIIGVTDGNMIQKKVLWELIKPVEERINQVTDFLNDIDPTIKYNVVPIYDPFGPALEFPDIDCIVVSEETAKGGDKVNSERAKKGYRELEMYAVPLIEDPHKSNIEETKVSSSSLRIRLLGKLLKHPEPRPHLPNKPYLIGLTGGIASGKSSIAMLMHSLGAEIISCDKLAHQTYECGTKTYNSIVHEFGKDVIHLNGAINHKILGTKVFENELSHCLIDCTAVLKSHKSKRQWLNNLIWPEVQTLVKKEVQRFAEKGAKIILLEVPLLIEAGWQNKVHQVWTTIITESEAVKRLKFRNGLSEAEAWKRIHSQVSNAERIKHANVVFCTQWDPDYTKKQVERAWEQLQDFLKEEVGNKL